MGHIQAHAKKLFLTRVCKSPLPCGGGLNPSLIVQVFLEEKPFHPKRSCGAIPSPIRNKKPRRRQKPIQPEGYRRMEAAHFPLRFPTGYKAGLPALRSLRSATVPPCSCGSASPRPACSWRPSEGHGTSPNLRPRTAVSHTPAPRKSPWPTWRRRRTAKAPAGRLPRSSR